VLKEAGYEVPNAWFLTDRGTSPQDEGWKPLTWKKVADSLEALANREGDGNTLNSPWSDIARQFTNHLRKESSA
jgi:hypothetical protein